MRAYLLTGIYLLFFSALVHAETLYVSEVEITLRQGPGNDKRIIAMIQSGLEVNVLEKGNTWTHIRLPDGKTGWMLSRYLTSEKPEVPDPGEYDEVLTRAKEIHEENEELKAENEALLVKARKDARKLKAALEAEKDKADTLEKEIRKSEKDERIWWFLSGGGVFLIGFIIGSVGKRRSRRSYL